MADEKIAEITTITNCDPQIAAQYLQLADGDPNQAITLFFENGGADLSGQTSTSQQQSSRAQPPGYEDPNGVVHLDSDDEDEGAAARRRAQHPPGGDTFDSDMEMARRLQEEMYGGQQGTNQDDEIRAPIARQAETLVGPHGDMDFPTMAEMPSAVEQQMRAIQQRRSAGRPGIFNQQAPPSIWNNSEEMSNDRREALSRATGGASDATRKSNLLAELYRPPFDLMYTRSWEDARDDGKEQKKWLLVNIQDPSVFDCQVLNRDIWKNESIVETVKENFIFLQYSKEDPRASPYLQYYFQTFDNQEAYPHIAIVDPRTGEQVKTWSGPPVPKPADFLMQLHEFLDRYSLRSNAKMPVAKRKPEVKKEKQVSQMTEEEQLEMALKASMAGQSAPADNEDPDDLTRSIGDLGKGKGKAQEVIDLDGDDEMYDDIADVQPPAPEVPATTPFRAISSTNAHTEPPQGAESTRISFRHPAGRVIRRFLLSDHVRRIYEWLKASPLEGKEGSEFDLIFLGKNLIDCLDETIEDAGLKNGTVMVEFTGDD